MEAPYIPVISPFESFTKPGANHTIKNDEYYIVKIKEDNVIYNKNKCLMFGNELKNIAGKIDFEIIAYMPIIAKPINDVKEFIGELLSDENEMPKILKKGLLVMNIGKLGKKYNRKRSTTCFKNESDALIHMKDNKGMRFELFKDVWIVKNIRVER
jgi:hypothetical protein